MSYRSETSLVRAKILDRHIYPDTDNGIDLGYGGDPISVNSISMDLPQPYAHTMDEHDRSYVQHLRGDARNLYWFADNVLDYVYSSHLLEDFRDTEKVLREWLRVIRTGGRIILCLPDEAKYRLHCSQTGQPYNANHSQPDMSLPFMTDMLVANGCTVVEGGFVSPYSFYIVGVKL